MSAACVLCCGVVWCGVVWCAGKATITGGRSEVLRSLRHCTHYLRAQSQRTFYYTIDRLEERERGVRKTEEAPRSTTFLERTRKGPSSIYQTNSWNCFQEQHLGTLPERRGGSAYGPSRAHRYHLELNCGVPPASCTGWLLGCTLRTVAVQGKDNINLIYCLCCGVGDPIGTALVGFWVCKPSAFLHRRGSVRM